MAEPFQLTMMPALQASFGEWSSPNFHTFQPIEICLLGLIALGFSSGIQLPLQRVLLLLALCHMALAHVRHAELLGFVGPLAIAASLGPQIAAKIGRTERSAVGLGAIRLAAPARASAVALALAIAVAISLPELLRPIERVDDPVTPAGAVAAAARTGLHGAVFNSEGFGGYLIFRGIPTFIDGRVELYGDAFLARYLEAESGNGSALAELLEQFGITWTLLMPQQGTVRILDNLPGWHRVYADTRAVIHQRVALRPDAVAGER